MATIHGQNTNDFDTLAGPFQVAVLHAPRHIYPYAARRTALWLCAIGVLLVSGSISIPKCLRVSSVFGSFVTNISTGYRSWCVQYAKTRRTPEYPFAVHPIACDG